MKNDKHRTCGLCQGLISYPMYMITPLPGADGHIDERLIIAAQLKCSCDDDIIAEYGTNAADLSDLKIEIRKIIYKTIKDNPRFIPVMDPEEINKRDCVVFVTGFDKKIFRNWLAIDLITLGQFKEYVDDGVIALREVKI